METTLSLCASRLMVRTGLDYFIKFSGDARTRIEVCKIKPTHKMVERIGVLQISEGGVCLLDLVVLLATKKKKG